MEHIPLPTKMDIEQGKTKNHAKVVIQPCFPGYGTTLGNALRRVLLSSLPGAAVTGYKIKGANHEFSALPNVKEDMVEISLNLKQLRLKVHSTEPVRLTLQAKGEKVVTAAEIKTTSDVEIINKDLQIATLTDKNATFEMELLVSQGRGYVPTEAMEEQNQETDIILLDSIFTPMKSVGIKIDNVRVGQMTNYEKLILDIETDGTIEPAEAVAQANQVLLDHFNFIAEQAPSVPSKKLSKKTEKNEGDEETKE